MFNKLNKLLKYKKVFLLVILLVLFAHVLLQKTGVFAQATKVIKSNKVTTKVGNPTGPPLGDTSIANCTFYRGGDRVSGVKFNNPLLVDIITEISDQVGVPAAIVAGVLRVETGGAFIDNEYIKKVNEDYDAHSSGAAFGIMQFTPDTFEATFKDSKPELNSAPFNKLDVKSTIDPPESRAADNFLRIYSIKDSILAAAFKIKTDKKRINGNGPWDENTVKEIAASYYGRNADGTTNYQGYDGSTQNYGNDLWKSYSECLSQNGVIADASCPIPGGKIGCASYGPPYAGGSGFGGACAPDRIGNGGHCNENYIATVGICIDDSGNPAIIRNGNLLRTAKSIDVANNTRPGDPIYLPSINGKPINWRYDGSLAADKQNGAKFGWIRLFKSTDASDGVWSIHFIHVSGAGPFDANGQPLIKVGDTISSGQVGATVMNPWIAGDPWPHVHITAGLNVGDSITDLKDYNPGWKFADRDLSMCK